MCEQSIGIIDSGIGGTTVLREVLKIMPNEKYIYMADTRNMPYGEKTKEEIIFLSINVLNEIVKKNVKVIFVACNTICSVLNDIRHMYNIPIFSIVESTVDYVISHNLSNIIVYATNFTVNSGIYKKMLTKCDTNINVCEISAQNLAQIIDSYGINEEKVIENINNNLKHKINMNSCGDIILGCTHYPIVMDIIKNVMVGYNIIDPAINFSKYAKLLLEKKNLLTNCESGSVDFYTTGDVVDFSNSLKNNNFINYKIKNIKGV